MTLGSILVGAALALVVVVYVARPFRRIPDLDAAIEAWIAREAERMEDSLDAAD